MARLTKQNILKRLDQRTIMERYFPKAVDLRRKYCSPFRADNNRGCHFGWTKRNNLVFFDHAMRTGGDCFDICMKVNKCNFHEALKIINTDFNLGLSTGGPDYSDEPLNPSKEIKKMKKIFKTPRSEFDIKTKKWQKTDTKYWQQFNITAEILDKFNVKPAWRVRVKTNRDLGFRFYHQWHRTDPMYVYIFNLPDNKTSVKIYRPRAEKQNKWRNNAEGHVHEIQGWAQLPKKNGRLIITKSLKDVMTLYSYGYCAIAPHSEGAKIPTEIIEEVKSRFDKVYFLYDNDEPGIRAAQELSKEHSIPYKLIPVDSESKDISDFRRDHGDEETRDLLNKLFHDEIPIHKRLAASTGVHPEGSYIRA